MADRRETALRIAREQLGSLEKIRSSISSIGDSYAGLQRIGRWRERTVRLLAKNVSMDEAQRLENLEILDYGIPFVNYTNSYSAYQGHMGALVEILADHPEEILERPDVVQTPEAAVPVAAQPAARSVFIVHGRDEVNLLRLEKLLKTRWELDVIIMRDKPAQGRTLIEKFEQEAEHAAFAIALFSPDDFVETRDAEYLQARPNVIFELGYFYGKLGRRHVCILLKKGTKIHSDLDGINTIEFLDSVEEKMGELEKELQAAILI